MNEVFMLDYNKYAEYQDSAKEKVFASIENFEYIAELVYESTKTNDNILSSEYDVDIKTYLEHIRSDMVQVLRMIGK